MASSVSHVGNPLTLIAVFASLSEAVSTAALPFLGDAPDERGILIWFVVLFPSALVLLFFATLWLSPQKLYGPGDFKSDEGYLAAQQTLKTTETYVPAGDAAEKLRGFWKPGGTVDETNARSLEEWLAENHVGTSSITAFLASEEFRAERDRAIAHFGL